MNHCKTARQIKNCMCRVPILFPNSPLKINDLTFLIFTVKLSPAHKLEEHMASENCLMQYSLS